MVESDLEFADIDAPFVFNKRSVNISKFQVTLYQILWSNKLSNLNFLVHTEIARFSLAFIPGPPTM